MAELLKDAYSIEYLSCLAIDVQSVYRPFKTNEFLKSTLDETWENLELKARCRKITTSLGKHLPSDYKEALAVIDEVIKKQNATWQNGFALFFPDFVEVYGQDEANFRLSIAALERYTPYASAEFAVRPFIINHQDRMMKQMLAWTKHESEDVRRLASEGCRPALPWGQALNSFKKDPSPVLPILEQLKTDPSMYVRKSVANNLNDISKTHPDLVAKIAKDWYGENEDTNWIVKHGCRTLLKKGNADVLAIFGFFDAASIDVNGPVLDKKTLAIGESITFSFDIFTKKETKVRLEYGIDYVKASGKTSRKIFQISELLLKENEKKSYDKSHSFADLSTRRHYPGVHSVVLMVNGAERGKLDFNLSEC